MKIMPSNRRRNVRQTRAAASFARPAAGLSPARSGPAGLLGRGPRPDPAAAPATGPLKRGGLPRNRHPREENGAEEPAARAEAATASGHLPAAQYGRGKDHQRHRLHEMHQVPVPLADALGVGEDGDEVPSPHRTSDPQPAATPKRIPLPWVTRPRELPFRTGDRP